MWRNRALALALASLLLSGITWGNGAVQADETMERIREKGSLRVAVYKDFPPYSYAEGGRYVGIDVDIARALAERMGLALDLMPVGADESVGDDLRNWVWKGHYLGGGTADLMMHVPFDPDFAEENGQATLFAPYFREHMAMVFDSSVIGDAADPAALARQRIGAEIDSVADYYLSGAFSGLLRDAARRFPSNQAALAALGRGELDAVLAPRAQIEAYLSRHPDPRLRTSLYSLRGMLRSYWDVGLAIKADNQELRAELETAMSSLRGDGSLQRLLAAHGVSYVAPALASASAEHN